MNAKTLITVIIVAIVAATAVVGAVLYDARDQLPFLQQSDSLTTGDKKTDSKKTAGDSDSLPAEDTPAEDPAKKEEDRLTELFSKEKASNFNLMLVNKSNKLPEGFEAETEDVQNGFRVDTRIAEVTRKMIEDAKSEDVDLLFCSAYRSGTKQENLFEKMVGDYVNDGKSTEEAKKLTSVAIAEPGTSEHQTGLAIDIVTPYHQGLDAGFADTEAGQWLSKNAWKYGFILRYPEGKEDITGYMYESWHYRYVGPLHAKLIKESGLCLEEYLEQALPQGFTDDTATIDAIKSDGGIFLDSPAPAAADDSAAPDSANTDAPADATTDDTSGDGTTTNDAGEEELLG